MPRFAQAFRGVLREPGQRETVRAFALFAVLFAAVSAVSGRLVFQDLSQLATFERLERVRQEARSIADAVAAVGRDSTGLDFYRIRQGRDAIDQIVRDRFALRPYLREVEVVDRFGGPVLVVRNDARRGRSALDPGRPDEIESVRVVDVPLQRGPQPSGELRVTVSGAAIDREIEALRRSFRLKVGLGAAVGVGALAASLFYVLHLIRKNRVLQQTAMAAERQAYKGMLASGLAHEIRNPLNSMNINLQMLEEELQAVPGAAGAEWQELLGSTKSEIKRLERLVNNFLQYARPTVPRFEVRDLNALLRDTASFLQADFKRAGMTLEVDLEPLLPSVEMDEGQVKQALMNVLVNARQVLSEGGRVRVRSSVGPAGDAVVEIEDDGPGIAADALPRIFEPFYSQRRGGTGLGLPIAKQIAERHGGALEVDSEAGRGTTFRMRLPRRQHRAAGSSPAEAGR